LAADVDDVAVQRLLRRIEVVRRRRVEEMASGERGRRGQEGEAEGEGREGSHDPVPSGRGGVSAACASFASAVPDEKSAPKQNLTSDRPRVSSVMSGIPDDSRDFRTRPDESVLINLTCSVPLRRA